MAFIRALVFLSLVVCSNLVGCTATLRADDIQDLRLEHGAVQGEVVKARSYVFDGRDAMWLLEATIYFELLDSNGNELPEGPDGAFVEPVTGDLRPGVQNKFAFHRLIQGQMAESAASVRIARTELKRQPWAAGGSSGYRSRTLYLRPVYTSPIRGGTSVWKVTDH